MKISTNVLKVYLTNTHQCSARTIKRISKIKNENGETVRRFDTDKGQFVIVSDQNDENIIKCTPILQAEPNGFYFCYDPKETKEYQENCPGYIIFLITPKKYFDEHKFLSDRGDEVPLDLLGDYFAESMESVFETSLSRTDAESFLLSKGFVENKSMLKCGQEE